MSSGVRPRLNLRCASAGASCRPPRSWRAPGPHRAVNPELNAIVTLDREGALAAADEADQVLARGEPTGPLHGLPIAVKDLEDTAGIRTTYGSPIFRDHVPAADTLLVARLRRAGAIVIGKTNTPEFGAGSQTFNAVFGATRNPFDHSRTPGGSRRWRGGGCRQRDAAAGRRL